MSRRSRTRASVFICYRCLVSAKLIGKITRERPRLDTLAFLSADNKRCSTESDAYVHRTASPTGASGKNSNPPMRPTTTYDETRGKAAKHPTAAKFGGVAE